MQTRDEKPFANAGDARYLDKYFLKSNIWPESYLLIRTITQTSAYGKQVEILEKSHHFPLAGCVL